MMKPKVQKKIPLFSVITAAYRAKPFLHRYFQTLSNQTICDFEVILSIRFDSSEEKNSTSKIIHKESEILKRKSSKTEIEKYMTVARNWIENNFSQVEIETVYSFLHVCADLYVRN